MKNHLALRLVAFVIVVAAGVSSPARADGFIAPKIGPVRPYGLIGLGLVRTHASFASLNALVSDNNNVGWDGGAGLMIFFDSHAGVRGDVRYVSSLQDLTILGFTVSNTKVRFGRASAGVLKF